MSWLEGLRAWAAGFALDLKLGGRMLVKYPGLTIVGGLAMAFAICVGTVVYMLMHVRGDPMTLGPSLREIAAAVDPTLRLSELQRMDEVTNDVGWVVRLWLRVTVLMTAIALLLSLAGIYAVLSCIVARRTREIGVRVALGASRPRVLGAIFRRPLIQVALGVLAGGALIAVAGSIETEMPGLSGELSLMQVGMIVGYAVLMLGVCLLACIVPTSRALGVEPTVALRME